MLCAVPLSCFLGIAPPNCVVSFHAFEGLILVARSRTSPWQVVAQALGLALSIGLVVGAGVQLFGPRVLVHLAGEKSKEVPV